MPLPQTLNYTNKEYATIREELLANISVITNGRYTNYNESDPGIALLELYMSMVDNLLFYQDMMIQELYLSSARQRRNVVNLVRLIGYEFKGVSAATATVTLRVTPGTYPIYPVTISAGTQLGSKSLTTNKQIIFTTTTSGSIVSASDEKILNVVQGTVSSESFSSDGSSTLKLRLSSASIEKNSIVVYVDESGQSQNNAVAWSRVTSFYNSISTDIVYKIEVDEFSKISIIFGDGTFGKIPKVNSKIYVNYVVTDGAEGNIGSNSITSVISNYPYTYDAAGNTVKLTITSSTASAGGQDIETIEEAKEAAVGQLFSQNRALTRDDFKVLTEAIPDVDKAVAWGENEESNPDYRLMNLVRLCFFSKQFDDMYYNPASMSSYKSLRDNTVRNTILSKMPITTKLNFIDPQIIDIFMWIHIGVNTSVYDPTVISDNVKSALLAYYDYNNVNFGQDIRISDIYKVASTVEGVSWLEIKRLHTTPKNAVPDNAPYPPIDITLEKWKLPSLTDISFNPNFTDVSAPVGVSYIKITLPESYNIGINNITVTNPDTQSDIAINSFTYYPTVNMPHVLVSYTEAFDSLNTPGGFYNLPSTLNDSYIFTSSR